MGWLSALGGVAGGVGGFIYGGPAGAKIGAAGGAALGGLVDGEKEKKKVEEYNKGQAAMMAYSPWTKMKGGNYKDAGSSFASAVKGGAQGYMMADGMDKAGMMGNGGGEVLGSADLAKSGVAVDPSQMQQGMNPQMQEQMMQQQQMLNMQKPVQGSWQQMQMNNRNPYNAQMGMA